jgi:hypothetical protein
MVETRGPHVISQLLPVPVAVASVHFPYIVTMLSFPSKQEVNLVEELYEKRRFNSTVCLVHVERMEDNAMPKRM